MFQCILWIQICNIFKIMSSGVVEFRKAKSNSWQMFGMGVCCVVKDNEKRSFYIMVVDVTVRLGENIR